jgi:hypothetical protein
LFQGRQQPPANNSTMLPNMIRCATVHRLIRSPGPLVACASIDSRAVVPRFCRPGATV